MYLGLSINHIVAMAENRVIGRAGGMPWHIPEDFKFFKATTMGRIMIMGRKTWDSIGRPLPGRQTIVVSRATDFELPDTVILKPSVEEALKWCKDHETTWGNQVFIVGGGEIYRQTLDIADRIYLTKIHSTLEGDTTYPNVEGEFRMVSEDRRIGHPSPFTFQVLERKK